MLGSKLTEPRENESVEVRIACLERDVAWMRENTKLQAVEYARRLEVLNHAHELAVEKEKEFVSTDYYVAEHKSLALGQIAELKAEREARERAIDRVNEKFEDYVTRYEARQREIDQTLAAQRGGEEEARRLIEDQARKTNRNVGIMGLILALVVFVANQPHIFG